MRKLKIYLDTSIINFFQADDAPSKKEFTIDFFKNYLIEYHVFISEIVLIEINETKDSLKKESLLNLLNKFDIKIYDKVNQNITELAEQYINSKIIPENKLNDAMQPLFLVNPMEVLYEK